MEKLITNEFLAKAKEGYQADRHAHTLHAAMSKTEFADLAYIPEGGAKLDGSFTLELKTRGITSQKKTGRCWMFAALNIMRELVAEKCNLEMFELSQNYLAFYDKLEKSNNMLQEAIDKADKPLDDRYVQYINEGVWDGGYWTMAADLVKKYGVVPKSVMPETYQSNHTDKFMKMLNSLLRKDAMELRALVKEGKDPYKRKEEMLAEIYKAECIAFGEPVEKFDFVYRDKDNNHHVEHDMTPKSFYEKYIGMDLDNYITVTNCPTEKRGLNNVITYHYIGCMYDGDVLELNLSVEELKELVIKQIKDGEPVWFACDSGAYGDRKLGIWDQDSFDYEGLMGGVDFFIEKGLRLTIGDSFGTHAMLFVGVNFDKDGNPDRYKIENSWGDDNGNKGYFVCSDHYFNEYVYEGIINKKHLSKDQLALLEKEPKRLLPWEM